MSKDYYRFKEVENWEGELGDFVCEVVDGIICRQLQLYGGIAYWADEEGAADHHYEITDRQDFGEYVEIEKERITAGEFEEMWKSARG